MKIRLGFVSNSSTTTYICGVCGEEMGGMDLSINEADMFQCENGHTICNDHKIEPTVECFKRIATKEKEYIPDPFYNKIQNAKTIEEIEEIREEAEQDELECFEGAFDYESPAETCPLCGFRDLTTKDIAAYYLRINNITSKALAQQFKAHFGTYDKFVDWLKEK